VSTRTAWSVSQLTDAVRGALSTAPELEDVLVEGEVSNLSMPFSGHMYFTLKDAAASVRCVVWRSTRERIPFHPENGMTVVAHGRVDVYEKDGLYQLYVDALDPAGLGALALAVEQLARRLSAEGLFDPARKRRLPLLPRRVAVITSTTGAAMRDVLTVLRRRAPQVGVVIVPTAVQGDGAEHALVLALERAQQLRDVDVILLVRGGGSLEDLWSFNGELLARAIRASSIPVVTGVGHETDTTIADHAADRRAPTPSAAAETAVPETATLRDDLAARQLRLRQALRQEIAHKRAGLERELSRLGRASPARRLPELRQRLDGHVIRLRAALLQGVAAQRRRLDRQSSRLLLVSPQRRLPEERAGLTYRLAHLAGAVQALVGSRRAELRTATGRLEALSPRRVIERGYSLTLDDATGAVVASVAGLRRGQVLRTLLADGQARSSVLPTTNEDDQGST
jgi:exodeoxyribonuclease VII large subunit